MGPAPFSSESLSTAIFFVIFSTIVLTRGDSSIHNTAAVLQHLSSQTPYRFHSNLNDSKLEYPGCTQKKIWLLLRHGTRYPSGSEITGMNTILPILAKEIYLSHMSGKGDLPTTRVKELSSWSPDVDEYQEKLLTEEGGEENFLIAQRMKNRFPGAIPSEYSNDTFSFRYTSTIRARDSAKYFAVGLFDQKAGDVWYPPEGASDAVLRFYKKCERWQIEVKRNATTYEQHNLYGLSEEMNRTLDSISNRLGLKYTMDLENATLIYKTCGFETAWNKTRVSPWCYIFSEADAEVFEYYADLKHYWQDGYGFQLTYRQACVIIKDMFDTLGNSKGPTASFLFSHSGSLLKALAHLGLYKPEKPLTATPRQAGRPWRMTTTDCFSANLGFVLYTCADGDYILPLHQERPVRIASCETPLCSVQVLREHFKETINHCNFEEMCSRNTT